MPNYRAVSAGTVPPPPTPREALKIATQQSFDYSSFVFVGITSAMAFDSDNHPQLGHGLAGYVGYYWRGYVDKTDGNYLVVFALPTIFHRTSAITPRAKATGSNELSTLPRAFSSPQITTGTAASTLPKCSAAAWPRPSRSATIPAPTAPGAPWP